ncbi:sensor histidine kinase [Carboxylicivirga linearis]|uniref:histidine kinase n=1 Tax=Carboxylicivirga linearis TaxID=1628157 RepID=A0ABS5JNZ2_9BACT|nr:ATP-binding protein [Carboxylicivirga linearis]MBS2096649.1 PAS domain S-box protein [Carboxylicivirga linearis]
MGERVSNRGIDSLKDRIVNISLEVGTIMYAIAFAISFSNVPNYFNQLNYIANSIVLAIVFSVAIFRKRINLKIKSSILIFALIAAVSLHVAWLGIYSEYMPLIIMVPFFSILAFNIRKTIIVFASTILIIVILGTLHIGGYLKLEEHDLNRYKHIQTWLMALIILAFVSVSILIILSQFNKAFTFLVGDLEQKNKELAFSEQSYREIFNSSSDAIFKLDHNGQIEDVNDAMLSMYGYTKDEIKDITWEKLSGTDDENFFKEASKAFQQSKKYESVVFECLARKKNGDIFWIEVSMKTAVILGEEKILSIVRNIDEKKKTQLQLDEYRNRLEDLVQDRTAALYRANDELTRINGNLHYQKEELKIALNELNEAHDKLLKSEKMATLGVLAAGIAHEVNSPLQYIQGGALGIEAYFEKHYNTIPEDVKSLLDSINEGVNRSADIVASLNQFSRQKQEKTDAVNIHQIIDNCLTILGNKIKYKVDIEKHFQRDDIIVSGNEGQLHQVIINILTNAIQAMHNEGKINIQTKLKDNKAELIFTDNGEGIKPEDLSKLTEPFFTTKPSGEGTGLGLSISQKIIEEHKGQILFDSTLGKGTTVTIILPL